MLSKAVEELKKPTKKSAMYFDFNANGIIFGTYTIHVIDQKW